jgi:hypothetical protein
MTQARVVRYQAKPECAEENARLVRDVFAELAGTKPEGLRYATFRLDDDTFLHIAIVDGEENPLFSSEAFAKFQSDIGARCVTGPSPVSAELVGSYGWLTG